MKLILPNDSVLEIENGQSGYDAASKISISLAKKALAYRLDGRLYDLHAPIANEGHFEIVTEEDKEAIALLNHSTSHLLAHAIMCLYPEAHIGFGPSIDEGFYYDIDFPAPITDADLLKIEDEMRKIAKENHRIVRREVSYEEALRLKGNIKNVYAFSEDASEVKTNLSQRGANDATKYFLIPKELRENLKFNEEVRCQKIEDENKTIFIFVVESINEN